MKTIASLFLAAIALTTTARASQTETDSDVVVLPTYVVSTPRYLPFEKEIQANLAEVRQRASVPLHFAVELPILRATADSVQRMVSAPDARILRIAKS